MIPNGELNLNQVYRDEAQGFALYRQFIKATAGTDVVIPHNLGIIPKQAWIVSSEGKDLRCWFKTLKGLPQKDTTKVTLQFSDTNVICTVRIE